MATKKDKPQGENIPAEDEVQEEKAVKTQKPSSSVQKTSKPSRSSKAAETQKGDPSASTPKQKQAAEPEKKPAKPKKSPQPEEPEAEPQAAAEVKEAEQPAEEKQEIPSVEEPAPQDFASDLEKNLGIDRSALVFGGGLLLMGVLLMLGRLMAIPFGVFLWPFIFIIPGLLVLYAAINSQSSSGEGLSILGGILTSLGALFLVQSITGWWASWAYAWTLVAPTSVGIAQLLYGQKQNRPEIEKSGQRLINLGLTMFAIGFVFFEVVLGVSGYGLGRLGLPVFPMLLIFTGLLILLNSLRRNRK